MIRIVDSTCFNDESIRIEEHPPIMAVMEVGGTRYLSVCHLNDKTDDRLFNDMKFPASLFPE